MSIPPTVRIVATGGEVEMLDLAGLGDVPGGEIQRYGGDDPAVVLGERAQEALEVLAAKDRLKLIEFADAGVAMRSVQAKRSGDAFVDIPIAIRLHDPAFRRRVDGLRMLEGPRELKLDFAERYAFEHADIQVVDSDELLAEIRRRGWRVGPGVRVGPDREGEKVARLAQVRAVGGTVDRPPEGTGSTVTIVVAYYNHDRYLEATLASLAAQTRPADEVIVIDDGSPSVEAQRVFGEQEARYPGWRFIRQENVGPGATRNRGLELASGTYFLPFDSDNIAVDSMVERFVRAMDRNPGRAATTCHNLAFTEDVDIAAGRFSGRYSPTGGPLVLAAVENVFGDTCSIFRTEALRAVGGFEINRWSPTEDWETFVKMVSRGLEIDVLPRPLFYYRTDAGGRLQHLGADRATKLRLRAHLLDEFLLATEIDEADRRDLFEALQSFDDFVGWKVEEMLADQRRWHDEQMADLDGFREQQVESLRAHLEEHVDGQAARADAAEGRAEGEKARAEAAEAELQALREATSGPFLGRAVRWRAK
jgi:glycosyltransferase involved in cell wall biosynthesis